MNRIWPTSITESNNTYSDYKNAFTLWFWFTTSCIPYNRFIMSHYYMFYFGACSAILWLLDYCLETTLPKLTCSVFLLASLELIYSLWKWVGIFAITVSLRNTVCQKSRGQCNKDHCYPKLCKKNIILTGSQKGLMGHMQMKIWPAVSLSNRNLHWD